MKAQSLLQVARRYPDFPIILETYRECLRDVFDLPSLQQLLGDISARRVDVVDAETQSASPFASSLIFDYVATYMYEDDTPIAERRAQALSLDRDVLRELLGTEELRELLDVSAVRQVEQELRGGARTVDELHDLLLRRGDQGREDIEASLADVLVEERRALWARLGGTERLIAIEDAGRYRDAFGVVPPGGLPEAYLDGGEDAIRYLLVRFARGRGPFTSEEIVSRFGGPAEGLEAALTSLETEGLLVRGELRPGGAGIEWCDPDVLRRLRRSTLARLRKEIEPVEASALARFLPRWQGVGGNADIRVPSCRCKAWRSLPLSGSQTFFLGACATINRRRSISYVRLGMSSGSAQVSSALPSSTARTHPLSAHRAPWRSNRRSRTTRSKRRCEVAPCSGRI